MSANPDIQRLVGDIVRAGLIASVDHAARRCTVEIGDMETGPLPWLAYRAGRVRLWSPPSVGEQCLLICAEGDTNAGFVLPGLYCDAFDAPDDSADRVRLTFEDGSTISYDMAAAALAVALAGSGTAEITAPGGLTITGDVTIAGNVSIDGDADLTGTLDASEDVIGGGKSLKSHMHSGVQPGSGQSGGAALMRGMSARTGRPLDGEAHLAQSIADILRTPIGTRVGRREYGSLLPLLIDQPMNAAGRVRLFAASALAIARWEPRIKVTAFALAATADGKAALAIIGRRRDLPRPPAATRFLVPLSAS